MKALRLESGIKAEDVAEALGITTAGYYAMEAGKVTLKVPRMLELCKLYGISAGPFFEDDAVEITPDMPPEELQELVRMEVAELVWPAFDVVEDFHKLSVQLGTVLKSTRALKYALDRVGAKK